MHSIQTSTAQCSKTATTTASTTRMLDPLLIDVSSDKPVPVPSSATLDEKSTSQRLETATITASTTRALGPLLIDVSPDKPAPVHSPATLDEKVSKDVPKATSENSSVQIIDITHSSVPKDTNLTVSNKTSTPQILPPARKSSSTPRRTSHIRVLDFTTPRRILHETINEQEPNNVVPSNIISNENTDFPRQDTVTNVKTSTIQKADINTPIMNMSTKENSVKIKKNNWDAQLRALAIRNDDSQDFTPKSKPDNVKKRISQKDENIQKINESNKSKSIKKKLSPKKKKSKKKISSVEVMEEKPVEKGPKSSDIKTPECTIKPTVNIINDSDWNTMESKDKYNQEIHPKNIQQDVGKLNYSDEAVDTPENERFLLQNEIGARLNISDLLETPYKQVLYDIQMETPKFLGPDVPGEPISDIKIMNIPTPRFLVTPKALQATPSSYSSRPTDYSSGGSYYKPDDHDFIPATEVLECAVTVIEEPLKDLKETHKVTTKVTKRESRPQRKCTKNVSYRSLNVMARCKEIDSTEIASVSSDTSNASSREKKPTETKSKVNSKNKKDKKKVANTHMSPLKRETPKKGIRIRPFKKTPIKGVPSKGRKSTSDLQTQSSKSISRKRTSSKEKGGVIEPVINAVPTKSRRKSSTPRKLQCTKSFSSDSVDQSSSDLSKNVSVTGTASTFCPQDSDNEQQPLRWSDDGSQDTKPKETESNGDVDDISKIREFIETSEPEKIESKNNSEGSLHIDLVKRGFDVETARIIERDLLDATPTQHTMIETNKETCEISNSNRNDISENINEKVETDNIASNNLQIVHDEIDDDDDDFELSVYECTEDSNNFITCEFDESKFVPKSDTSKLKDKFCMEVCIDDGVSIRLRPTPFKSLIGDDSIESHKEYNSNETEAAVSSISNIDKLYTPIKDRRAQCYEIFDSTLTSIDTPLKAENSKETVYETTVTDIILEVENIDTKDKSETKKRKRAQSGTSDESLSKKTKPDTQYLLNSANIQNIDIESVLSKLHGP